MLSISAPCVMHHLSPVLLQVAIKIIDKTQLNPGSLQKVIMKYFLHDEDLTCSSVHVGTLSCRRPLVGIAPGQCLLQPPVEPASLYGSLGGGAFVGGAEVATYM